MGECSLPSWNTPVNLHFLARLTNSVMCRFMLGQTKRVVICFKVTAMPQREILCSAENSRRLWFLGTNRRGQLVEMSQKKKLSWMLLEVVIEGLRERTLVCSLCLLMVDLLPSYSNRYWQMRM